jgi:hypothetical protein
MSYSEEDAADAWHRIYAFFGETLAPDAPDGSTAG